MGIGGIGILDDRFDSDRSTVGCNCTGQPAVLRNFESRQRFDVGIDQTHGLGPHRPRYPIRHGCHDKADVSAWNIPRDDIVEITVDTAADFGIAGTDHLTRIVEHIVIHHDRVSHGISV